MRFWFVPWFLLFRFPLIATAFHILLYNAFGRDISLGVGDAAWSDRLSQIMANGGGVFGKPPTSFDFDGSSGRGNQENEEKKDFIEFMPGVSNSEFDKNMDLSLAMRLKQICHIESKHEKAWRKKFAELKALLSNRTLDDKLPVRLMQWLQKQRREYASLKQGKPSKLDERKVAALFSLDTFWWKCTRQRRFEKKRSEYKEFRHKFGIAMVPFSYDRVLCHWVRRVCKLANITFPWDAKKIDEACELGWEELVSKPKKICATGQKYARDVMNNASNATIVIEEHCPVKQRFQVEWQRNFEALEEFLSNATLDDPMPAELSSWIQRQRRHLRKLGEGDPSPLNCERIFKLQQLDPFWWKSANDRRWELRCRQFTEYRQQHGDGCITCNHEDKKLLNWVVTNRYHFKKFRMGEPSPLTLDKVRKLKAIKFPWDRWDSQFGKINYTDLGVPVYFYSDPY